MTVRPKPPIARPGHHFEAVIEGDDWRLSTGTYDKCRGSNPVRCPGTVVLELRRPTGAGPRWYAYCAEHTYGRWVEGAWVWRWREVEDRGPS